MGYIQVLSIYVFLVIALAGKAETFKVALPFLPKFNPITTQMNMASYVGMHLYYPLIEMSTEGKLASHFLDLNNSKASDQKFIKYDLCLKDYIEFSDKTEIKVMDFYVSLKKMAKMYPHLLPLDSLVLKDDRCVTLEMKFPTPNLFKRLTGVASTIIKGKEISNDFPVGLGPYKLSSFSDETIVLKYSGNDKIRFDKIEFIKINDQNIPKEEYFQDINKVPKYVGNAINLASHHVYDVSIPKVYSIVVNLESIEKRLCAVSILSKVNWINAYGLNLEQNQTFLPWKKKYDIDISAPKNCPQSISLTVPDIFKNPFMSKIISNSSSSGKIKIVLVSDNEFGRKIFSGEEYIGLIGFDATSSVAILEGDYSTYFESFFSDSKRIMSRKNNRIKKLIVEAMKMSTSVKEREILFSKAETSLIQDAFVFPVGRLKKQYVFPISISISEWFDYVNGIPDVSKIK